MFPYGWAIIQRRHNEERQRTARRIAHRHIRDHSNPFDVPAEVFTKLYRLSKRTAHFLVECLHQNLNRQRQHGIPVHIKVLASLHFFGHGGYQTMVGQGQYLGLSQPSESKCLQEVADEIITVLLNGDSGYAQLPWLMTPYADANENTPEARYNLAHTKTRVLIEKCFGVMKTRFRCIHKHRMLHYDSVKASKIIAAVVVLHNVAIKRNEPLPDELELEDRLRPADDPPRDMNFLNVARNIRNNITRQYFA
ncbi:unnamed protein product [Parnassius apollo]|uniref:(apollo) hypothetical protein n=1 Tax=Parnassius apollo TaxID=110799 RepID=A0A8S3WQW6_PARAO|nr:unnamed protein product [Parnassius apollo]